MCKSKIRNIAVQHRGMKNRKFKNYQKTQAYEEAEAEAEQEEMTQSEPETVNEQQYAGQRGGGIDDFDGEEGMIFFSLMIEIF